MANITITQVDNTITANSTTDVINVTETTSNIVVSSSTITEQINLSNVTVPIESNSNISTDANITGDYVIANTAIIGDLTGDVYAADGTSKVLENGTDGSDATFTGDVTGDVTGTVSSIANHDTDALSEGSNNLYYTRDRANSDISAYTGSMTNLTGDLTTTGDIRADELIGRLVQANAAFTGPEIGPILPNTSFIVRGGASDITVDNDEIRIDPTDDGVVKLFGDEVDVAEVLIAEEVRSRSRMILNASAANQGTNAYIYVNRVGGVADPSDAYIKWNETTDNWEVFDGTNTSVLGGGVTSVNGQTGVVSLDTDDIAQGSSNLYYANSLVDNWLQNNDVNIGGNLDVTGIINGTFNISNTTANEFSINAGATFLGGSGGFTFFRYNTQDAVLEWSEGADRWEHGIEGNTFVIPIDTSELPESGNLYFTTDRANSAITTYLGDNTNSPFVINGNLQVQGNIDYVNVEDLLVNDQSITLNYGNASALDAFIYVDRTGSTLTNAHIKWNETADQWEVFDGTSTVVLQDAPVTSVNGATGVVSLDTDDVSEGTTNKYFSNTLARGAVSAADDLSYNSTTGVFSVTTYKTADFDTDFATKTTSDLTEGTNLYYTTDRANAAIADYDGDINTTGNITAGTITATTEFFGDLDGAVASNVYNNTTGTLSKGQAVFLTTGNQGDKPHVDLADNTDPLKMPALGIVKENIGASSEGQVVTSGVMNFSSHGFSAGADLYIHTSGNLTETVPTGEDNLIQKIGKVVSPNHIIVQGAFRTNATPNLDEGNIFLGSSSGTAIAVTPDSNFDTTGNVFSLSNSLTDINTITSEASTELTLFGQSQVGVNQLVDSTESRVVDLSTTGYALNTFDLGTANVTTDNVPGFLVSIAGTSGTNTLTAASFFPIGGGLAAWAGKQTSASNFLASWQYNFSLQGALSATANLNLEGWTISPVPGGTDLPVSTRHYVTGISGNDITLSENLTSGVTQASYLMFPGAHSTTQDLHVTLKGNTDNSAIPYVTSKIRVSGYNLPETLSNVTLDVVSYGDSSVDIANATMRHMADLITGPDSAVRTERLLLIGANATPDFNSIGEDDVLPPPSALGLTLENDGLTFEAEVNTAPVTKFLINQFNENGLTSFTEYPEWTEFLGESGNAAVDMKYLGSPTFQFKTIGGTKDDKKPIQNTDVVGRITWSPVIPGGSGGSDAFHPPASIVARVPGDTAANATISNVDVHFQSTYATSYRNGANTAAGTIPRTFLSSNEGSTVLAAKPDGSIQLKPQRDYGDSADATSFVENRFAHELHEYHTFLSAQFKDTSAKTGTMITIQPDSGETGGTTDFNYDSKGDAVLRLQTNLSNGSARYNFDITHAEDTETLTITSGAGNTEHLSIGSDNRIKLSNVMRLNPLSNSAILALSPNEAGDVVYSTDANKVCYYNGTSWKTIDDNTDIV